MFRWLSRLFPRDVGSLQLWEVLRRRGLRRAASRDPQALALAVKRCARCSDSAACSELLASGQEANLAHFCPNAMYAEHLRAMERHAPKQDLL